MNNALLALTMVCGTLSAQDPSSPQEAALKKVTAELAPLIKAADADGNGTLSKTEFRAFGSAAQKAGAAALAAADPSIAQKKSAKTLKKYDKNADGKLDDDEKKALDEALRLKEIKDFDWDGDGKLSEHEKTAMGWAQEGRFDGLFRKVDADANGEASLAEISAGLSTITGIKVKKV